MKQFIQKTLPLFGVVAGMLLSYIIYFSIVF